MPGFPYDETLDIRVRFAPGADLTAAPSSWSWTDLTRMPDGTARLLSPEITIEQGTLVGSAKTGSTSGSGIQLLNNDGALTPMLATSPFYPYVDAGTPVEVAVRSSAVPVYQDTWSRVLTGVIGTADSGQAYTTSGVADMTVNGSDLAVRHTAANSIRRLVTTTAVARDVDVSWDVSVSQVAASQPLLSGVILRQVDGTNFLFADIEFLTSGAVQLKPSTFIANAFTGLGQVVVPGLTYTAGTRIRVRAQVQADRFRMRAWAFNAVEPTVWHIDVQQTAYPLAGRIGYYTWVPNGSTNTMPLTFTLGDITATRPWSTRLAGYLTDAQPQFLPQPDGSTWSTVMLSVGGVASITEKGDSPSYSPLRRSVQQAQVVPIAYWPLEDAEGSLSGASAYPGGPKMLVTGPAVFGFSQGVPDDVYQSRYGTKPLLSLAAGARITAPVPRSTVQNQWAVTGMVQCYAPEVPGTPDIRLIQWQTQGSTYARWALVALGAGGYEVRAYDTSAGTTTTVATFGTSYRTLETITVEAVEAAGTITIRLFINDAQLASGTLPGTLAAVSNLTANPDRTNTTNSVTVAGLKLIVGHLRVLEDVNSQDLPFAYDPATGLLTRSDRAWYLETAHTRIARLCAEERVPFTVRGNPNITGYTQLNGQRDGAFTDLISQAAESESGSLLYESGWGYAYLARSARYSLPVTLSIDLATYARSADTDAGEILVPQLESRAANFWTVERYLGSTGSYAAPAVYRKRRGTIGEQVTVDVLTDAELDGHAAWRTHLAVDALDAYYPSVPLDLAANPGLIDAWLDCLPGSRVQRLNQPTIAGLGTVDQVIDGWSETIGPRVWSVTIAGSPAKVWDVAVTDRPLAKADTDGTTIRAASSTATTLLVDVTAGPRWTTDPAQMPILVTAATGEDMRITACSGTSNPQTWTVVRSLNGVSRTLPAGTAVSLTLPARSAL